MLNNQYAQRLHHAVGAPFDQGFSVLTFSIVRKTFYFQAAFVEQVFLAGTDRAFMRRIFLMYRKGFERHLTKPFINPLLFSVINQTIS